MKISKLGGIIAAASEEFSFPMYKIGNSTAIRQIVKVYQQVGIFPIVIIYNSNQNEVRNELISDEVVFIHTSQREGEMFDTVKQGFQFLQDSCEKIVFSPVNAPMFSHDTLLALMQSTGNIVTPSYQGKSGHPIIISSEFVPRIMEYQGGQGLRGALAELMEYRDWVIVEDKGIRYTVRSGSVPEGLLARQKCKILHLNAELKLTGNRTLFDSRTKLLLFLIYKNGSVKAACEQMALSSGKAWDMLNTLGNALQIELVARKHGGYRGGRTILTEQGIDFLQRYQQMEEAIFAYTQNILIK